MKKNKGNRAFKLLDHNLIWLLVKLYKEKKAAGKTLKKNIAAAFHMKIKMKVYCDKIYYEKKKLKYFWIFYFNIKKLILKNYQLIYL